MSTFWGDLYAWDEETEAGTCHRWSLCLFQTCMDMYIYLLSHHGTCCLRKREEEEEKEREERRREKENHVNQW